MPDMPMPPMPTKWMVPMESGSALMRPSLRGERCPGVRCAFDRDRPGVRSASARGHGCARRPPQSQHGRIGQQPAQSCGKRHRIKLWLRHDPCAARCRQGARVGRLMVIDSAGQRHKDRGTSCDCQLGKGRGAGTGNHQMRCTPGVPRRRERTEKAPPPSRPRAYASRTLSNPPRRHC